MRRSGWLLHTAAFLLIGGACFAAGVRLVDSRIYEGDAFDADPKRVVHDINRIGGTHYRTKVHPFFVLLLNPPGVLLRTVVSRPRIVALLLDAAASAGAVLLLFELLLRLGLPPPRAVLWSALFATSTSQIFFGVVPETYAFSSASLLLLFLTFARARPAWPARLGASLLSFGILVTNLAAALALAFFCDRRGGRAQRLGRVVLWGALVVLAAAGLSVLQKALYPESEVFFLRSSVSEEADYLFRPHGARETLLRSASVGGNLFFANLAAPQIVVERPPDEPPVARFGWPRPAGWVHAFVWASLCALAAHGLVRSAATLDPVLQALLAWLAWNGAFHLAYGPTLFLYSCQWTFALVAIAAVGVERTTARSLRVPVAGALALLVCLQLLANVPLVADLYALYR